MSSHGTSLPVPDLELTGVASRPNRAYNFRMRALAFALLALYFPTVTYGQAFESLKGGRPPSPPNLDRYVRDSSMLLVLGKALFWDMQVGSDGRTACATCHFHAGADHRAQNQLSNPGGTLESNHQLLWDDFP